MRTLRWEYFDVTREEVTKGSGKLQKEELHACVRTMRNYLKMVVRKPEGKRPCKRPSRRWENNIK